jgi:hypothetical protein
VLNHNNRIYPRAVFEKVISDTDINEKLSRRTLFGEAEHPITETSTRLDRSISHIVQRVWIDENTKQAFASLDVLNTPHGQLIHTLLLAECQVGVSTRAEGELEEAIDESSGNKYFRVIPEAYQFKTIDFTADPSTLNALPVKVEHNIVRQIKSGVGEGKIDKVMAVAILENFHTKAAIQLYESLKLESETVIKKINEAEISDDKEKGSLIWGKTVIPTGYTVVGVIKKSSGDEYAYLQSENGEYSLGKDGKIVGKASYNEGKVPNPGDQDTQVVNTLIEKAVKEDIKDEVVSPVEEITPTPDMISPVTPEVPTPDIPVAAQVQNVVADAKAALDTAVEIVAQAEEIVNAAENDVHTPMLPLLAPEAYMGDPAGQAPVIPEEEDELLLGENKKLKSKLANIREELIKESKSVDEAIKKNLKLIESYQGYANYETWNVILWLHNDEGMYNRVIEYAKKNAVKNKGDRVGVRKFVEELMPNGTPDFEDRGGAKAYDKVSWGEVASAVEDNLSEGKTLLVSSLSDKIKVNERVLAESLKKITRLEKMNEGLKKDNDSLKKVNEGLEKDKRTIAESINRETVKRYVKRLTEGSGYSVSTNTLTLLESCETEEEAEKLFEGVKESLNEAALHSNGVSEIRVPLREAVNPEQAQIQNSVSSAFSRM